MEVHSHRVDIKVLYNKLFALRFILQSYMGYLDELQAKALVTLQFLRKEYGIKE
jgi:hypothetical protein